MKNKLAILAVTFTLPVLFSQQVYKAEHSKLVPLNRAFSVQKKTEVDSLVNDLIRYNSQLKRLNRQTVEDTIKLDSYLNELIIQDSLIEIGIDTIPYTPENNEYDIP